MTDDLIQMHPDVDCFLDDDPAYQEWSETIEKQNQQQQDEDMIDHAEYRGSDYGNE